MEKEHIPVNSQLKQRLEELKGARTWNEFLNDLANLAERASDLTQLTEVVNIPHTTELEEEIIEAIEEAQPPPEWRLLLIYLLTGLFGGIGIGLWLALK